MAFRYKCYIPSTAGPFLTALTALEAILSMMALTMSPHLAIRLQLPSQLLYGVRNEAIFSVYATLIPKFVAIPATAIPLALLKAVGFVEPVDLVTQPQVYTVPLQWVRGIQKLNCSEPSIRLFRDIFVLYSDTFRAMLFSSTSREKQKTYLRKNIIISKI